ncbi:hypothetical protein [Bdellovibrio sp.]|uniref:hypothetical protein n=1 Tax=Bdellovibrio sp. TaxID=28201 RepID=UPI002F35DD6A
MFSLVTIFWTLAMFVGAADVVEKPTKVPELLRDKIIAGSVAWLDVVNHGGAFHIFAGVSMLLAPLWAVCAWNNRARVSAVLAVIISGLAASGVCTGTIFSFGCALGGVLAPFVAAAFLAGYFLLQARAAIQKTLGVETDDERRLRMQKEQFAEDRRDFRRRLV